MRTKAIALVVALLCAAAAIPSNAQLTPNTTNMSPNNAFGFGINNAGLHVQYALNPAFQVGVNLNMDFMANQSTSDNAYNFGPYAKYLFGNGMIKPYIYGAVGVIKPNSGSLDVNLKDDATNTTDPSVSSTLPDPEVRTYLAAGGEYFFNPNVGVYGHVNLVDAQLSPEPIHANFGLRGGVVGVEFFFE